MPSIQLERSFGLTVSPRFRQDLSKLCLTTHSHQTFVAAPDVISAISIASLTSHFTGQIRYDHHIQHRSFAETLSGCINVAALRASGKFFNGERPPKPIWLTTYGRGQLDSAKRMRVTAVTATTKTNLSLIHI